MPHKIKWYVNNWVAFFWSDSFLRWWRRGASKVPPVQLEWRPIKTWNRKL